MMFHAKEPLFWYGHITASPANTAVVRQNRQTALAAHFCKRWGRGTHPDGRDDLADCLQQADNEVHERDGHAEELGLLPRDAEQHLRLLLCRVRLARPCSSDMGLACT